MFVPVEQPELNGVTESERRLVMQMKKMLIDDGAHIFQQVELVRPKGIPDLLSNLCPHSIARNVYH
jgi:hypothetical protein